MTTLNRAAAELMRECHATAATDVTGFGLIGHAAEMARGAGVTIRLELCLDSAHDQASLNWWPTAWCRPAVTATGITTCPFAPAPVLMMPLLPLFDPQTSGGLLIALAPDDAERFLAAAEERGIFARLIGSVLPYQSHSIELMGPV